jgi:hypothetical protein
LLPLALSALLAPSLAHSFCGFYVARGDAQVFNRASQVVLVRDGDRSVVTMVSDFRGAPSEFAVVVPVPTFIERKQIHIGDKAIVDHLDAYSAPRLVEYFDPDPCPRPQARMLGMSSKQAISADALLEVRAMKESAVRVEASYKVDEYDIQILSADDGGALERWLTSRGYRMPDGAAEVLAGYLRQGMRFFVAKIDLKARQRLGIDKLRPIQVAFESPKFALPIRLGMVNADGPQELFVYALTRSGRVETTNYRTVKLPSDLDVPVHVKEQFAEFYRAMFTQQTRAQRTSAVFTEYAWDMGSCDPCASSPLSPDEQRQLGVFWLDDPRRPGSTFVTRLHVRYDRAHFPEDLVFQETGDRSHFQGRYVLRHEFKGPCDCGAGRDYVRGLRERRAKEAQNLATLTGWNLGTIRERMAVNADWSRPGEELPEAKWWERLWSD